MALAALGRQTAVPLAVAAAVGAVLSRGWDRPIRLATLALSMGVGVFCVEWAVSRGFLASDGSGVSGFTIFGSLRHPIRLLTAEGLAGSDARAFLGRLVWAVIEVVASLSIVLAVGRPGLRVSGAGDEPTPLAEVS